jgi:hypothetical protein
MFALEPMLARQLSARHGAGYQVWNTSMMYYSGALLVGYLYAHGLAPRFGRAHLAVVAAALLWVALEPPWRTMPGGPRRPCCSRCYGTARCRSSCSRARA